MRVRLIVLALPLTGCFAYGRAQGGTAFSTSETRGHSGPILTLDAAFRPPFLKRAATDPPSPLVVQTSAEALLAPERKDLAWGTGLGLVTSLVPVGAILVGGTNAHVGFTDGKVSFGNLSPYLDLGVRAPLSPDLPATERQGFISLDLTGQTYFDFLSKGPPEYVVCIKFGAGFGN